MTNTNAKDNIINEHSSSILNASSNKQGGGLTSVSTLAGLLDSASAVSSFSPTFPFKNEEDFLSGGKQVGNRTRLDVVIDESKGPNRYLGNRWKSNATVGGEFVVPVAGRGGRHNVSSTTSSIKNTLPTQTAESGHIAHSTSPTAEHIAELSSLKACDKVSSPTFFLQSSIKQIIPSSASVCSLNTSNQEQSQEIQTQKNDVKSSSYHPSTEEISLDQFKPSTSVWKPRQIIDPVEKMRRNVNSLLNKLTVENFHIVAERLCLFIESVSTEEQLTMIIWSVLDKAFSEPDFSEMYADLCLIMGYRVPVNLETAHTEHKPNTTKKPVHQTLFHLITYSKWKEEFNRVKTLIEDIYSQKVKDEEQDLLLQNKKVRFKGLCNCFSEFIIRRMVGIRVFNNVIYSMLSNNAPAEYIMEGVCQMLTTAGNFLDNDLVGKVLLDNCFGRLQELQFNGQLSNRIECLIQDLIDARNVQWHRKVHKEKAKSLAQIQQELENANLVGGSTVRAQYGTVIQLGQRLNLNNQQYAAYIESQERLHQQRVQSESKI